jgi:hypothetical protein
MKKEVIDKFIFEKIIDKKRFELSPLSLMHHILKGKVLDFNKKAKEITNEVFMQLGKDQAFDLLREKIATAYEGQDLNKVTFSEENLLPEDLTKSQKEIGEALSKVVVKFTELATSLIEKLK